ncbi:methyltransferase domain-containing protein [Candidatus Bathyarchaeota archaeon]|nr:methyltransferase domain-containing protein [Candidatus Bathyarchaeota archaeon]
MGRSSLFNARRTIIVEDHKLDFRQVLAYELSAYGGRSKLQVFWRLQRINVVMQYLERHFSGREMQEKTLADVGCGPGIVASMFARRGYNIIGIDHFKPFIEYATKKFKREMLDGKFILADVCHDDNPLFENLQCNSIICIDAFEHFTKPGIAIDNFKKILGEAGGKVFLTMPNFRGSLYGYIEKIWDDFAKTPGWKELHVTRLKIPELISLFSSRGFKIEAAGTFLLTSPFLSVFSLKLARMISHVENYLLEKVHWGFMIYLVARI